MTIDKMREKVKNLDGVVSFKFNGARNQVEEFDGEIIETYPKIFVIKLVDENVPIRSFTYSDLLTESLEIVTK